MKIPCLVLAGAMLAGCAGQALPVLYPNAKFKQVGDAAAQRDVDDCVSLATKAGAGSGSGSAMRGGMTGAAVGGAAAAVGGLIRGGNVFNDAAAGAAIGGTAGAVGGAMNHSGGGNPAFQNFVGRCMAERGYEVIGWK